MSRKMHHYYLCIYICMNVEVTYFSRREQLQNIHNCQDILSVCIKEVSAIQGSTCNCAGRQRKMNEVTLMCFIFNVRRCIPTVCVHTYVRTPNGTVSRTYLPTYITTKTLEDSVTCTSVRTLGHLVTHNTQDWANYSAIK